MPQNPEARSFLQRVQSLPKVPGVSLNDVLQPSLDDEAELRKLFATERQNTRLNDKYVGLVDVFDAPEDIRTIRARIFKNKDDLSAKHVMPLLEERKKEGEPCMVPDLEEFRKNWSVFTEGSLSQLLDWNNVLVAGGSVLACLTPLPEEAKASKRAIRKYYHSNAYPTSDVDIFLYGMTPEQAEVKIAKIYEAVRDSVPWDVTCVRTKHTVSIHSQYPYRSVQIVLRLYSSPAEILAGFDIDSSCFAYDGTRIWGNPRSIVSMMRQCNTVDMSRRSPSYEVRLAKYSSRHFEVYVPTLKREDVDPTIYERSITRVEGLARLLVFEKLKDAESRDQFLESRRTLRSRLNASDRITRSRDPRRKKQLKGDLKANMTIGGLEMNDYDVVSLHIPYGPGWDARRIEKLDLGMNSPFNPKNKERRLHRHPAFFGTAEECLIDCCELCPDPIDEDERKLQKEEGEQYIRGRISFIEEDPGRQSLSGSFKPIDVGEWSEQVYIGPTEKFFAAIVANERAAVTKMIEEGIDVNRRDHVGRMPLHVAIMAKCEEIVYDLIDNGARITSRLADGRTALHLAAKLDMPGVVKKLLERSKANVELLEKEKEGNGRSDIEMKDATTERPSSEDDWSSDSNGVVSMDEDADDEEDIGVEHSDKDDEDGDNDNEGEKEPPQTPDPGALPEDGDNEPDVFDVNAPDWNLALTPLNYAIIFASMPVINALLDHEDLDLSRTTQAKYHDAPALVPLASTMYREDEEEAVQIVERLVAAGASSSTADDNLTTILMRLIHANKTQLVLALLRVDPKTASIINFPAIDNQGFYNHTVAFPLNYAVSAERYAIVAALLAYGAKTVFDEKDVTEALTLYESKHNLHYFDQHLPKNRLHMTVSLIENAVANYSDLFSLLVPLGAPVNAVIAAATKDYVRQDDKLSLLDWARVCIDQINEDIENLTKKPSESGNKDQEKKSSKDETWKSWCLDYFQPVVSRRADRRVYGLEAPNPYLSSSDLPTFLSTWDQIKTYLTDVERILVSREAKPYNDLCPNDEGKPESWFEQFETAKRVVFDASAVAIKYEHIEGNAYDRENPWRRGNPVPQHQVAQYEELFEACYKGDNPAIQRLCSQSEGDDTGKSPIQIAATIGHPTDEGGQTGLTTLSLAVAKRHWETARLIYTISAAQYKPDGKDKKFKINLEGFHDDDSDGEGFDTNSEASDDTIDQAPIDLVDVAERSTQVQVSVPPSKMLNEMAPPPSMLEEIALGWWDPHDIVPRNLITAAVAQKDVQAFTNIFNLYKLSDPPVALSDWDLDNLLSCILHNDQPEMLHEYIRKTGKGVTVSRKREGEEKHQEEKVRAVNDKSKVYYGLNVHGKKRKDLAAKNDPNATGDEASVHPPLLWRAAVLGSSTIVDYLKTERPLEAYRYYAMCNSDELAISLRRTSNLDKVLPQWLGWTINSIGESPLSAAILGGGLKMVKQMFGHDPKLMSSALKEDIKFIGFNLLMVAVYRGCTTKMVDFLLSNGLNPAQTDSSRGWNIYHILAGAESDFLLFQHFLKKLPRDLSEALLVQQSKKYLDTPLHLAVENAIISFNKSSLTMRNIKGSLSLHIAILHSYPEITKLLLQASPTEVLHSENGVGDTPIEIATSQHLLSQIVVVRGECSTVSRSLESVKPKRFDVERLEKDAAELRKMIASLLEEKKLTKDSQLERELSALAHCIETRLASAKSEYEARKKHDEEKSKREERDREGEQKWAEEMQKWAGDERWYEGVVTRDSNDPALTFKHVKEAVDARPSERKLVHLVDVQKSVLGDLDEVETPGLKRTSGLERSSGLERRSGMWRSAPKRRSGKNRDKGGLEPEEQKTRDIPDTTMIFQHHWLGQILS